MQKICKTTCQNLKVNILYIKRRSKKQNTKEKQKMKNLKTIAVVRERERESNNLKKLGSICNAKNLDKRINKRIIRMNYYVKVEEKRLTLLYDSLSFL